MLKSNLIGSIYKGTEHFYIAEHFANKNNSIVYIARDDREIFQVKEKLEWLLPKNKILIFRSWDQIPYDKVSPTKEVQSERIKTLYELVFNNIKNFIVLTSVNAIVQKTVNEIFIKNNVIEITKKQKLDFHTLIHQLIMLGYQKTSIVREKSEFAVRGNIIDIYLTDRKNPIRLDFFDNIVESIKEFDFLTQKTSHELITKKILINPSSEILLTEETIKLFRENFRNCFVDYRKSEYYHSISEGILPSGIEQFLPFFNKKLSNFFLYCTNSDFLLNSNFIELLETRFENIKDFYQARIDSLDIYNIHPKKLYLNYSNILNYLSKNRVYQFQNFVIQNGKNFDLKIQSNLSSIKKEIDFNFIKKFIEINSPDKIIIICTQSKGSLIRIKKILSDNISIKPIEISSFEKSYINKGNIYITVLKLEEAVQYEDKVYLNEKSLFGYNFTSLPKKSKQREVFFEEINKFSPGIILVHIEYGFCKFIGVKKLNINESLHDCIELEFADDEKLFLPIENLNFISRYSNEDTGINLDKLGSFSWQKRKAEAKKRIKEIADDLIKTAAKRFLSKSPSVTFDSLDYDKFASTFPFVETEDQLNTIEDIKSDFLKKYPSDRLIVGDVAYGKSEIIIRAVFLISKSTLQSLILVPTTLLARQHYYNFVERFESFGIKIKQLSRLVSISERKETINELKSGKINCVVGTHALLSENIEFKNLGLIVVDEEQHFGVKAKEKLKNLSSNAHIITLSATPIPRTLQLSLSGIRELSLMLTPPYERLSIRTYISLFDKITIKEAIKREVIGRHGGVFWVTPRKRDIPFLEKFLKEELPNINYTVAHGQLPAKTLESRVSKFYDKKIPILISTNIIESGLDLPNVNTIIIHRANMFGLSQLHQLRGRVGRSANKRGYAYLTYQKETDLSENSLKRLNIINTYDKLGSGFSIASSDMDLRGSGNIIGTDQSGFVKEVGIELYNQLLEEEITKQKNTILEKKGTDQKFLFQPRIKLPESIFIPDEYINDIDVKISLYKRIALITSYQEKENIIVEIIDRFGSLPQEVENLFKLIEIKILCYQQKIEQIDFGTKGILISFFQNKPNNPQKIIELSLNNKHSKFTIRPDNKVFYDFEGFLYDDRFSLVKSIIKLIS